MTASLMNDQYNAIEKACMDYVEGFYDRSAERIKSGVNVSLAKRKVTNGEVSEMSRKTLIDAAVGSFWHKPEIKVQIFDVCGNIASAKILSDFIDYAHLALIGDKWQVINVLWDNARDVS